MHTADNEIDHLLREHRALLRAYGRAQARCSELLRTQAREIERLHAQDMRLRAEVMLRTTALAWAQEDHAALEQVVCGPPHAPDHLDALEASLVAADLVICQTGCLSHGAYWRVQDHCKRTGKACVLVAQPAALRIMRIHKAAEAQGHALITPLVGEADA